jgi:multiple sugar transport system substrate-binding protein
MKRIILSLSVLLLSCSGRQTVNTLEFWQFWTDPRAKPVIESIVAQFERENPNWKVNITDLTWADGHQKIVVAFGADNPPDLLELGSDWIAEFAAGQALSRLDINTSLFFLTEPGIFENKIYAQPWFLGSRIVYFNKTLLNRVELQIPEDWQGLLGACSKINALGNNISGFGANSAEPHRLYKKFLPFVWSCRGSIVQDGKIMLDNPDVLKALEFYGELARCGRVETQRHLEDAFCEGKIGFVISGGWLLKRLRENPPLFEYQLSPMIPERRGDPAISFAGGEYLVIPLKSSRKNMARKLMEVMIREANIRALIDSVGFGFPPQRNFISQVDDIDELVLCKQLIYSRSTPVHPKWIYIEQAIEEMVEQVTLRNTTPQEAIIQAQEKINGIAGN